MKNSRVRATLHSSPDDNAPSEKTNHSKSSKKKDQLTTMSGIEQFTHRARRVLSLAHTEANNTNAKEIGTEHLLIGLMLVDGSTAGIVLSDLNLTVDLVRNAVAFFKDVDETPEDAPASKEDEKLSPAVQIALRDAITIAESKNQKFISTEHILLGILNNEKSHAVQIMLRIGVSPEQVRRHLDRVLDEGKTPKKAAPSERREPRPAGPVPARGEKKKGDSPLVDQLSTDLTAKAAARKLDPVVGRKNEIERVIQILARRTKNNPALIGEPGVGKTAIVEGLAQEIVNGNVPAQLLNKRVLQLDVGSMVAGTMYRGQFEERMKRVIEELKNSEAILFIDEVHMLVGAGSSGSAVDAANILKPALSRGEIQIIGATTTTEYRKNIESDAALERRFQPIQVAEPTPEEAIEILTGLRPRYEDHHQLRISDEAIEAAVKLSVRYVSDRFLPDKAIDLIDEGASRVRLYKNPIAKQTNDLISMLRDTRKEIHLVREENANDSEVLPRLRATEKQLESEIIELNREWDRETAPELTAEDVAEVISMWTGIPLTQVAESESDRLMQMEAELNKMIIGQEDAIRTIASAVRRSRSGLKDPSRPTGSFMFLGPTGVGKTELTKALATYMFGSEDALIQIDMSEFMERHATSRLIGSPPGYVGYDDAGQLTEAVRRRPYSIVVFDELDKAHPEVQNILLQIMEEGHLTDSRGKKVDFRNTLIIMTSNIGADLIKRQQTIGFTLAKDSSREESENYDEMRRKLLDKLKKAFRPEFVNRLDNVIVFRMLNLEDIERITEIEIGKLNERLGERGLKLVISDNALEKLTRDGYDPEMGARPVRRIIQQQVEDKLADVLLSNSYDAGTELLLTLDESQEIVIRPLHKEIEEREIADH